MSGTSVTTSHSTRTSTPITEDSRAASPDFHLPPDTPDMIARRETTDRASSEIGRRLLQGWAMLADECLNESCYGTPLMRPPPTSVADKNPRKECVVCGRVYVSEKDAVAPVPGSMTSPAKAPETPATGSTSIEFAESSPNTIPATLRRTVGSLEMTLERMAKHMENLSAAGFSLDVHEIGETADAIAKVAEALSKVHALEK